ncbi:MAG: FG-GAP-like repeat-containing protein [Acidobacteriales bacterium]|nr:FG-GAP-like repeat-containing protein [Terriglobales bacterium]
MNILNEVRSVLCRATVVAVLGLCVPESLAADVLHYYRFENNYADSGSGARAGSVLAGTPSFNGNVPAAVIRRTGQANTASLSLNTSTALVFDYPFPFNTLTNGTLEFYVNPSSFATSPNFFWTTTNSGDANRFNLGITTNGSIFFDYRDQGGTLHQMGVTASGGIIANQWNFVAIVKTGNSYSIYVNNLAPVVKVDSSPNLPTSTRWTINGRGTVEGMEWSQLSQFSGLIDEVRLSDQALSPAQFLNSTLISSSTTLASTPNPALFGATVTLTATVLPAAATGKVTFYDGTTVLGVGTLAGGTATLRTILLPAGNRFLRAFYGGDSTYAPSTSTVSAHTVNSQRASSFLAPVNYGTGTSPSSIAIGDFNGDGKADLAVAKNASNNVSVLLGNGNGTFQTAVDYSTGVAPYSVAIGDFNGDGKADLAVANWNSANVSVLLGNGNGTFQAATNYQAGTSPLSVVVGDFNGDGKADLVVTNYEGANVSVLLGNGNGTFQIPVSYPAGSQPNRLAIGDFNGDGNADLIVAHETSPNVSVLLGNGNGTFQAAVNYGVGESPHSVAVGDFNGDGKADVAAANVGSASVSVLLGNGDGTFQTAVNYTASPGPVSVTIEDFNGDGKADLAVGNWSSAGTDKVNILLGNGNGTFQTAVNYAVGSNPGSVTAGDFNGDGKADLVVANGPSNNVSVLLGAGTVGPQITLAGIGNAASYAAGKVSPGEIIVIFGKDFGPATLAGLQLANGLVATEIGETRVLFDGVAAPMVYAVNGQVSCVVPYEVAGKATTQIVVEYKKLKGAIVVVPVVEAVPGLFSINSSGTGPGAFLNEDGSVNTAANPLERGKIAVFYGTGEGQTMPAGISGLPATTTFPKPLLPVTVTIGGKNAEVLYAGAAPYMVAGVIQINAKVPTDIAAGNAEVIIKVGNSSSQVGVTLAVK